MFCLQAGKSYINRKKFNFNYNKLKNKAKKKKKFTQL